MEIKTLITFSFWTAFASLLFLAAIILLYFVGRIFLRYRSQVHENIQRNISKEFDLGIDIENKKQSVTTPLHKPAPVSGSSFSIHTIRE